MDNWTFFIIFFIVFIVVISLLWVFFGGHDYPFEGLKFLDPPKREDSNSSSEPTEDCTCDNEDSPLIEEVCESHKEKESKNLEESEDVCDSEFSIPSTHPSEVTSSPIQPAESDLIVKLPSLSIDYYKNFLLNINIAPNGGKHMSSRTASESRGEKLCRSILEKCYEKPFPTVRPDFLINPESNYNLELDCYNADLGIALEYNGIQHYIYPNRFHKTEEEFQQQIRRDGYKKSACKSSGVYLITVPYNIPHSKLPQFIEYNLPENVNYRQKHGIEGSYEDEFWGEKEMSNSKKGFL